MARGKYAKKNENPFRILVELLALIAALLVCVVMILKVWSGEDPQPPETQPPQQTTDAPAQTTQTKPPETQQGTTASTTKPATQPTTQPATVAPTVQTTVPVETTPEAVLQAFMQQHNLTEADYNDRLMEVYQMNPDAREFVLNYPLEYGKEHKVDISGVDRTQGVPLFLQWDPQWGYLDYGTGVCGTTGCGPTCLAMAAYYFTGDPQYSPAYMIQFAKDNGYVVPGSGTSWALFNEGVEKLGLAVKELPLSKSAITKRLDKGEVVVLSMGPGDFTIYGHFILVVGYDADGLIINDPNSPTKSQMRWPYAQIEKQIKNLWAIGAESEILPTSPPGA